MRISFKKKMSFISLLIIVSVFVTVIVTKGDSLNMSSEDAEKISEIKKSIRSNPDNIRQYENLHDIYSRLRMYDKAIEALDDGIEALDAIKDSKYRYKMHDYYYYMSGLVSSKGRTYMKAKEYGQAISYLNRALMLKKETTYDRYRMWFMHVELGDAYALSGAEDRAYKEYLTAIGLLEEKLSKESFDHNKEPLRRDIENIYKDKLKQDPPRKDLQ